MFCVYNGLLGIASDGSLHGNKTLQILQQWHKYNLVPTEKTNIFSTRVVSAVCAM